MMLKENETLFQEFKWTVSGDAKNPDSDVNKVVSPYLNLNTPVGKSNNTFRFAIRLFGNGRRDAFKAIVYCYVHNTEKLGIIIKEIHCAVKEKALLMQQKVKKTFLTVFTTEFASYDGFSEKDFISIRFRFYLGNVSEQTVGSFGYELRDTCLGEEIWLAAQSGFMTDCEFVVDNETFQVHKAIVASRCPVLAERIGHESNNRIEIHDVANPIVFKALLYFLYTGQFLALESPNELQFVELATKYQVKMAKQINGVFKDNNGFHPVEHHSEAFAKFIVDLQHKLEYVFPARTIENYGSISVVGRGILLAYNYNRSCKAEDTIIPVSEIFRFEQGGFLGVTLLKSCRNPDDHKFKITCSAQVLSGFRLQGITINYTQQGGTLVSSTMSEVFQHDKAAPKLFQREVDLTRYAVDRDAYQINIRFSVQLSEIDERWGYRIHDPSLPLQLWSASKEQLFTDVEIRLRDKTFHAHRAILSARSSVFAAMFGTEMSESRTGIVEIEDINADVFEEFLEFLYTARLRTTENLEQLWVAADKYDLKTLEFISEPYVYNKIRD